MYEGKFLIRFDDTNPSKEKAEFEQSIVEDLALLGVHADSSSYTSDYFDQLQQYCVEMIKKGKAYADDTEQEVVSFCLFSFFLFLHMKDPVLIVDVA